MTQPTLDPDLRNMASVGLSQRVYEVSGSLTRCLAERALRRDTGLAAPLTLISQIEHDLVKLRSLLESDLDQ